VLGVAADKESVAREVATWNSEALETAVVGHHGCAAAMRSLDAWAALHPQGIAVDEEPLIAMRTTSDSRVSSLSCSNTRPLAGIRVLDLTRVLAGPVATRFLAGFGAEVLRIDPLDWDEPAVVPDVTVGKRCARLDLRSSAGRATFLDLLSTTDVLVHGYRADALDALGLDVPTRRATRPGLIDVALNAYGWTGPWRNRRGFDSLVQMSTGIADAGMKQLRKDRPAPLPVQALDHASGYLMAAAAVSALTRRLTSEHGVEARLSLARCARLLTSRPAAAPTEAMPPATDSDWSNEIENTDFGPAHRPRSPVTVGEATLRWDRPAVRLGCSPPAWW
jgi:hypothetical protein